MDTDVFCIGFSFACLAISFEVRRRTISLFPQSANHAVIIALTMAAFSVVAFLSPRFAWDLLRDIMCLVFIAMSVFLLYWKSRGDRRTP